MTTLYHVIRMLGMLFKKHIVNLLLTSIAWSLQENIRSTSIFYVRTSLYGLDPYCQDLVLSLIKLMSIKILFFLAMWIGGNII